MLTSIPAALRARLTARAVGASAILALAALAAPAAASAVVGGTAVPSSAAPWVVQVASAAEVCTGTLVAPGVVLTDAHCVTDDGTQTPDPAQTSVLFPAVKTTLMGDQFIAQQVAQIAVEPGYNPASITNDLALIQLSETEYDGAYAVTVYSQPTVTLATTPQDAALYAPGAQAAVGGWGVTTSGSSDVGGLSTTLQEGGLLLEDPQACQDYATSNGWNLTLDQATQFCAQGADTAPVAICRGDSGGPLFATVNGQPIEIGVSDFGTAGCPPATPSYFTSVLGQSSWLSAEISALAWTNPTGPSTSPPATSPPTAQAGSTVTPATSASVTRACERIVRPRHAARTACVTVHGSQSVRMPRYTRTITISGTTTSKTPLQLRASGNRGTLNVRVRDGHWNAVLPARNGWLLSAARTDLQFVALAWDAP